MRGPVHKSIKEEVNRVKREILANLSHEFRTPLNSIIGFTELIHSGLVGTITAEQKEYLADVLSSAYYLQKLIDNILDLSNVESGVMTFYPSEVDLKILIHEIYDNMIPMLIRKRIGCELKLESLPKAYIDPIKFKQILFNYVSNAIKFSPVNSTITISLKRVKPDKFKLAVIDQGKGIKKNDFKKLFVEFSQLDSGVTKAFQGTGVGLALTKKMVTLQGGKVGVESVHGKGSTFYAILPLKYHSNEEKEKMNERKE